MRTFAANLELDEGLNQVDAIQAVVNAVGSLPIARRREWMKLKEPVLDFPVYADSTPVALYARIPSVLIKRAAAIGLAFEISLYNWARPWRAPTPAQRHALLTALSG